jgi:putative transposase
VVDAPDSLSTGMQWLNGVYARRFNARHDRRGHLFQDRFWCGAIESDDVLTLTCEYVLNNALRAKLCRRAADWPWRGGSVLAVPVA